MGSGPTQSGPANASRTHLFIKADQVLLIHRRCEHRDRQPGDRGNRNDVVKRDWEGDFSIETHIAVNEERNYGGHDLAPGVDPPPVEAQDQYQSDSGSRLNQELPRPGDGMHDEGDEDRGDHQEKRRRAGDKDVMPVGSPGVQKALVEIVDQVRTSPVEQSCHRRHVGRQESGDQQPSQTGGQEITHRVDVSQPLLLGSQVRIQHHCRQSHQDPGPGTQAVVGDREPQGCQEGVLFVLGGKHSLGNEPSPSRLRSRVPRGPPLHENVRHKSTHGQRKSPSSNRLHSSHNRSESKNPVRELGLQTRNPSHFGPSQYHKHQDGRPGHGDDELNSIIEGDSPQPRQRGVKGHEEHGAENVVANLRPGNAEHSLQYGNHGQVDPAHHHHVDEQSQVEGAKSSQERSGLARVT